MAWFHLPTPRGRRRSVRRMRPGASTSEREWIEQLAYFALAVGERIHANACALEQSQVQICKRSGLGITYVTAALELAGSTGDKDRKVDVVMLVAVAHSAAVKVERVVEQRAVAFRNGLELLQEVREERDVKFVDPGYLREHFGVAVVVRERMVRFGDSYLGIGPVAGFTGQLERNHARHVALQRQGLEIELEPGVIGICGRNADGPVEIGQVRVGGGGFRLLNTAL